MTPWDGARRPGTARRKWGASPLANCDPPDALGRRPHWRYNGGSLGRLRGRHGQGGLADLVASVNPEDMAPVLSPGRLGVKRWADAVAAALLLIVLTPLLAILMLLIRLTSPGPAIFRQDRLGRGGRPFSLLSSARWCRAPRTWGPASPSPLATGGSLASAKFLRATSLDELPQFWLVVRGEMSLVGPRPLPMRYLHRFNDRQRPRLTMPQASPVGLRHEAATSPHGPSAWRWTCGMLGTGRSCSTSGSSPRPSWPSSPVGVCRPRTVP